MKENSLKVYSFKSRIHHLPNLPHRAPGQQKAAVHNTHSHSDKLSWKF